LLSLARIRAEAQGICSVVTVHRIKRDKPSTPAIQHLLSGFFFALGPTPNSNPRIIEMSAPKSNRLLSLDTWAVLLALSAAVLVHFGIIKNVPW
jgi:hypothetical protein